MTSVLSQSFSRRRLLLGATAAAAVRLVAHAEDDVPHVRILFLGDSYTAQNGLPAMVGEIVLSSRLLAPHIGSYLQGDHTVEQHARDKAALGLLQQGADGKPWDVLVVQEQSLVSAAAAVDEDARKLMHSGLAKIVAAARAANPQILVINFQVWARHESLWQQQTKEALLTGRDPAEALARIHAANVTAVQHARGQHPGARLLIAPVGDVWKLVLDTYPAMPLHAADGTHPDMLGTMTAALVIAGTIGGREVIEKSTWLADLPFSQVARVKKVILDHPEVFERAEK